MAKMKKYLLFILRLLPFFLLILLFSNLRYNASLIRQTNLEKEEMTNIYKERVEKETDPAKLVRLGVKWIGMENPALAVIALEKATKLEKEYRDANFYLGYARLKKCQSPNSKCQKKDFQKILEILNKTKDLDPIYAPTWQLLSFTYQILGEDQKAKEAKEKFEMFKKIRS